MYKIGTDNGLSEANLGLMTTYSVERTDLRSPKGGSAAWRVQLTDANALSVLGDREDLYKLVLRITGPDGTGGAGGGSLGTP